MLRGLEGVNVQVQSEVDKVASYGQEIYQGIAKAIMALQFADFSEQQRQLIENSALVIMQANVAISEYSHNNISHAELIGRLDEIINELGSVRHESVAQGSLDEGEIELF